MKLKKPLFLFLSLSLFSLFANSQHQVGIGAVEISAERKINEQLIEETAFSLLNAESDDSALFYNKKLKQILLNELNKEEALVHEFSGIQSISILSPSDSVFVLFNWNIPLQDGTFRYECGILGKKSISNTQFYFLTDTTFANRKAEEHSSTFANQWTPCLFYKVLESKTRFKKYYTLLFWDGNSRLTNIKGIDILWFDESNKVRFGAPLFKFNSQETKSRIVFEYGGQNRMRLQFNTKLNRIEFDHLSPPPADEQNTTNLDGIFEYYGPDLSFDGFLWKNNAWIYQADIDLELGVKKKEKDFIIDKDVKQEQLPMYKPN